LQQRDKKRKSNKTPEEEGKKEREEKSNGTPRGGGTPSGDTGKIPEKEEGKRLAQIVTDRKRGSKFHSPWKRIWGGEKHFRHPSPRREGKEYPGEENPI